MFELAHLLSADKAVRGAAEREFKQMQYTQPFAVCQSLLQVCDNRDLTSLALVLLRQTLKLGSEVWTNEEQRLLVGQALWNRILQEKDAHVSHKEIEAFVALPRGMLLSNFTPSMLHLVSNSGASPTNALLALMDGFAEFAFSPALVPVFAQSLINWLTTATMRADAKVQLFKAAVSLLISAEQEEEQHASGVKMDKKLLTLLGTSLPMAMIAFAAQEQDEASMESLCALAESCAWALDANIKENLPALLAICEASAQDANLRALAMAVIGSIVARKANAICKDANAATRLVRCILQLQAEEEDLESLFEGGSEVDAGDVLAASQIGPRGAALDCATSLAIGTSRIPSDSRNFLNICLQQIQPLLAGAEWRHKLAALSTLASIAPCFAKAVFRPMLKQVVQGCAALTSNVREDARVRYAAAAVIYALLSGEDEDEDETGGASQCWRRSEMQTNLHQDIIPTLAQCLKATAAASAASTARDNVLVQIWLMTLGAFYGQEREEDEENGSDLPRACIAPYLDGLVQLLVQLMQRYESGAQASERILCLCMDTLARLADKDHEGFAKYYGELVPMIKACLSSTTSSAIKKSAMLLVASCAEAVGKEQFARDGLEIVRWFFAQVSAQQDEKTNLDETNEVEGLFLFCERLVSILQREFAIFTPHILPLVVQAMQADLGLSITNNSDALTAASAQGSEFEEDTGKAKIALPVRGVSGGPIEISANVYAFQIRYKGLSLLERLAECGCVDPSAVDDLLVRCVLPNVADRMCTLSLNAQASSTATALFALHQSEQVLVQLATHLITGLALDDPERNLPYAIALESVFKTCVEKQTCRLPAQLVTKMFAPLLASFDSSIKRRLGHSACDEEEAGEDEEEEEIELCAVLVDVFGSLLKMSAAMGGADQAIVFEEYRTTVLSSYMVNLINTKDEHLRHHALCAFIDYCEFTPAALALDTQAVALLVQHLKYAIVDRESSKLRQVGAYGIGLLALRLPPNQTWCTDYKPLLRYDLEDVEGDVRDNMISAIAKLYCNCPSRLDWQQEFILQLPLKHDLIEAKYCYELVFNLVLSGKLVPGLEQRVAQLCEYLAKECKYEDDKLTLVAGKLRADALSAIAAD